MEGNAVALAGTKSEPGIAIFASAPSGDASTARPTTSLVQAGDVVHAEIDEEIGRVFLRAARIRRPRSSTAFS
jgi:hypothetical protein